MNNVKINLSGIFATVLLFSVLLNSCRKGDAGPATNTEFKVTDAAVDDTAVVSAFVTITNIKIDGISVPGFKEVTVDLAAYQHGNTKSIASFNLDAGVYNNVTFFVDYDTAANNATPGSYILATDGTKHPLGSGIDSILITKSFEIQADASNSIVADFDLRKMIMHQSGSSTDLYDFVTNTELQSSIRIVVENKAAILAGSLTDGISGSAKVIAYAYKIGTFDRATEIQGQGASGIEFKNAAGSAVVNSRGKFDIHFLEPGNYEIHFASYKDTNADGQFEFAGTLIIIPTLTNIDLLNLPVSVNETLSISATATGVL